MAFGVSKEIIEDIRSRCDIVELIGMFVQLRRAGTNTYKGLCPFHQEKTPSFHVDAARQTFHCFGCGKGGDVFRFFMEKENVGFVDALHMLASRVGVVIPENAPGGDPGEGRRRAGERERLFQVNEAFAEFFHRVLVSNPASPAALYLQKRGIPPEVAEKFRIGACPDDWTACLNYGRSIGFTDAELVNSGIVSRKAETGRCYDHFKGRLTFTIESEQGRAVGFSARALEATPAGGKYINTTETPIFKKGNLLYALPLARRMMSEKNMAIICEGQLDTIAFHRAGFACAVAPQGTSFTENQGRILRRYAGRIFLALDSDAAGQKAIRRDLEILLPMSFDIRVIRIPGGKDPDELFRNGGAEAVQQAVAGAVSWLQVLCDSLPERYDMSSPAGRGQAAAEVAEFLGKVTNQVELELYVREAATALGVSEDAFWAELRQVRRKLRGEEERRSRFAGQEQEAKPPVRPVEERYPSALLTLLALAVNYEEAARQIAELLPPEELSGESPPERAINLAVNAALNGEFDQAGSAISDMLLEHPSPAVSRLLVGDHQYADVSRAVLDSVRELRRIRREEKRRTLTLRLRQAATAEERTAILGQLVELNRK
ncbi:DNA primase [uncultured Victivallis sp.]|uniref:DNA primase n=1 Tax=uncultured Victivallis sp. TaxID=354118 RepID=UPI0025E2F6A5|nr:DNA primase [uncultured Victivallis sp.]